MTQEEKQLLFKDLCARLPYGVKCGILTHPSCRLPPWKKENDLWYKGRPIWYKIGIKTLSINPIDCFYPYLRPMSSMTEEEMYEYNTAIDKDVAPEQFVDWYNLHHFDYRGLIEKGLALEAPEGMYKIE